VTNASTDDRATKRIRRTARAIGSFAAAYWLLAVIGGFIAELLSNSARLTLEGVIIGILVIAAALGVLVAWRREGVGGALVLLCGAAHSVFAYVVAGHHKAFAVLVSGAPFLLSGALFLVSWRRSRRS